MGELKEALMEAAMKHKNVTAYTKGRLAEELKKARQRAKDEKLAAGGESNAGREAWLALNDE
jgi:hypothetical protein